MINMYPIIRDIEAKHGVAMAFKVWASTHHARLSYGQSSLSDDDYYRMSELRERRNIRQLIADRSVNGVLYVSTWSRDCDMCEGTYRHKLEADDLFQAYIDFWEQKAEDAEGPFAVHIITKEQYDCFQSSTRDRALEAFEDGHPHVIYA